MTSSNFEWANEPSRDFLNTDYLDKNETPESRVWQMALNAEKILGFEFAEEFYNYASMGCYSFSTPVWKNFGKDTGLPISCVVGDTWINTSNGGKMAKDIEVGDLVLTHKNRFKKVVKVIPTKNKDGIYKLKVGTRMTNLYITGNHLVLTNLGWVRVDELDKDKHLIAVNGELEYKSSEFTIDLKKYTDYNFIIEDGLIKKSIETENNKVLKRNHNATHVTYYSQPKEFVSVDNDLAWAFGLWFAEGSLAVNNKKEPNGIRITLNDKDEAHYAERWLSIMKDKFNLNGNIYKSEVSRNGKTNSWISVNLNSKVIGNLFKSFGVGCKNKKIPDWMLNLPKDKLKSFLDGILLGDGTKSNQGVRITLANPELLLQVYNIGLKMNEDMSLQMQEKAGKLSTTTHVYTLTFREYNNSISKNSKNAGIKFNDGLTYCPIRSLELTDKVEDVYDFTVEDDHSFSCAGVVVHNCFGIDIQDDTSDILRASAEIGMMTKVGGGTAGYFGNLRPRGASISNGGKSNGSVSFMPLFQEVTNTISQTNRRGFFAAYHDIEHDDFWEFIKARSEGNQIQTIALGLCVSDAFMQKVEQKEPEAVERWKAVIRKRDESGFPYLFFTDNVNRQKPQVYKDKNMDIKHSQMCVHRDTLVKTKNGDFAISDLVNERVDVWNGVEWSNVKVFKTGKNQKLKKVKVHKTTYDNKGVLITGNISELDCTLYHKWYNKIGQEFRTHELTKGMLLLDSNLPNGNKVEYEIIDIEDVDGLHDTYCFTEPKRNMGMFNGLLTGNCNEIYEYTDNEKSFVCCLSSINQLHWDFIKQNPRVVKLLTYFLDAVYTEFIDKAQGIPFMEKAVKFAIEHRSIGVGSLGWHSYLQSKMIPFDCVLADSINVLFWKFMDKYTLEASQDLARIFGEPEMLKTYGERFTTRLALAPTTSSSFILGQVSPSIEPLLGNCFLKDLSKGKFFWKNPYLETILKEKGQNTDEVWDKIMKTGGSVQFLDILSDDEKDVFKTFAEINQMHIIKQASDRQKYIDQGQSLNLMLHPETTAKDNNALLFEAWRKGLKGLYYQRSANIAQKVSRDLSNCSSCES